MFCTEQEHLKIVTGLLMYGLLMNNHFLVSPLHFHMGGLLYLWKLILKISPLTCPRLYPTYMDGQAHKHTHSHTHYHCGSAVLCCGRLKWPLWAELNISVHSGRASEWLLPPAASAPGTGCQAACLPADQPP